jgi:aryl-alcohol dehydrogenase
VEIRAAVTESKGAPFVVHWESCARTRVDVRPARLSLLGGDCGLIGAPPLGTEVSLDVNLVMAIGRTGRAIVEGQSVPDVFLPRLIELCGQGRFPVDRIMTHYSFDDIHQAALYADEGRVVKPVLRMGEA